MKTASRRAGALLLGCALTVLLASAAFAHTGIAPDVIAAGVESELTVFVGHGCFPEGAEDGAEGSPTVEISLQAPEGLQIVSAAERTDGWAAAIDGQVITWTGGTLPDGESGDFVFTALATGAEGDEFIVPLYQGCEVGEYQWAEPPAADGSEPERPASVLRIGDPSTATTEEHEEGATEAAAGTEVPTATVAPTATAAAAPTATAAPAPTATASATPEATTAAPASTSPAAPDATAVPSATTAATPVGGVATGAGGTADGGPAWWLIGGLALVAGAGAVIALRRRGSSA